MKNKDVCTAGTKVKMSKGYKGIKGVITGKINSNFEFYIIALDNSINVVAGPSAFEVIDRLSDKG